MQYGRCAAETDILNRLYRVIEKVLNLRFQRRERSLSAGMEQPPLDCHLEEKGTFRNRLFRRRGRRATL